MEEIFQMCCGAARKPDTSSARPEKLLRQLDEEVKGTSQYAPPASAPSAPATPYEPPASLRPMAELPLRYDVDWTPQGELGRGHFAKVFRGKKKSDGTKVAAKRILRASCRTETLHTEIKALARLSHPNIVRLFDVYFDSVYVVLVLEFLGGGELFTRIVNGGVYSERDAAKHFYELSQAIAYMHAHGVVHRDLKPENLVLAEPLKDSSIKITDLGLSKLLDPANQNGMTTVCGTKAYSAPEINFGNDPKKRGLNYSAKVDVWSMGVILFVLLGGYHPFDPYGKAKDDQIWAKICKGEWSFNDRLWQNISPEVKDLLQRMIVVDVDSRLTMQQVCEHPWFHKMTSLPALNLNSPQRKETIKEVYNGAAANGNGAAGDFLSSDLTSTSTLTSNGMSNGGGGKKKKKSTTDGDDMELV